MSDPAALAETYWNTRSALHIERGRPSIGRWEDRTPKAQAYLIEAMRRTLEAHGLIPREPKAGPLEGQMALFEETSMKRLEEIEARLSAATQDQWYTEGAEYDCGSPCTPDGCFGHYSKVKSILRGPEANGGDIDFKRPEDAALCANAPADLRYLLDFAKAAGPVLRSVVSVGCACRGQDGCVTCEEARQALALLESP